MKRLLLVSLMMVVLFAGSSLAFDGFRKGFVLGGGLGVAPTAGWSVDGTSIDDNSAGLGLNLVIGYAWDENNMIVYEGNVAGYSSGGLDITQGYNGAAWYHYFGPQGKSFFTVAGLGLYVFEADGYAGNDPGGAILIGGGYEFARHIQVGGYVSSGKTSDRWFDYSHSHFSILVSAVAF